MFWENNKNNIIKFLLLGVILFSLTLCAAIVRDIKDVLIIQTSGGAPLIAQLKSCSFLITFILFVIFLFIYRRDDLHHILFTSTICLLIFFITFHFWGYKYANEWVSAIYYLLADVWGAFAVGFLFWAFANQVFTIKEATLSYPLLFIFPNMSMVLGTALTMSNVHENWENIMAFNGLILLGGLTLLIIGAWFVKKRKLTDLPPLPIESSEMKKMSFSFKWGYLFLILIIITSFGFCGQLLNILFKSYLKDQVSNPSAYSEFMGQYASYAGYGSAFLFLLTFWMVWKFGWLKSALIPPLYVLISTSLFLVYAQFPAIQNAVNSLLNNDYSPFLFLIILQTIMVKGLGVLFLTTKEIAYIPLGVTTKARGKVTVDFLLGGVGASLGVIPVYFDFVPFDQHIECILLFIIGASLIWLFAVMFLGRKFKDLSGL